MDYSRWNFNTSCCKEAIMGMRIAEVSCMVIATILTIIFILALIKTKLLHANLRALFLATAITDFLIMYIRIYDLLHTDGLIVDHVIVLITKYTGWMLDSLLLFLILVERYYAIKHNETYDEVSMNWPIRTIGYILGILMATGTLSILAATGIYPRTIYIFGLLVVALLVFMSYFISLPINAKMIKRLETRKFTLNQTNYVNGRFQAYESKRSQRMLKYYIPFQVGTLLTILATATCLTLFVVPTHPTYFLLIQQSTYFLFVPRAIISMLIALILHPSLRRTTKLMFTWRKPKKVEQEESRSVAAAHVAVKSLSGKQLNFESDKQRDLYFESVNMESGDWNYTRSCCRESIISMKGVESVSICVLFILSFAYFRVIMKTKVLHVNLRVMLIAYSLNDVLMCINRIPDILKNNGEIVQNVATRTIKYAGWIMGVVILLNIMFERIIACWYYKRYDEWSNNIPFPAVSILVGEYAIFGFLGFAVTQRWITSQNHSMVLVSVSIITYLIFPVSQWMIMKWIRKREQKRFEKRIYNVNGRFQIHDLRRCAKMLRHYVTLLGLSWFITITIASYFQFFVFSQHPEYSMLAEQIGNTMNSPRAIISMLIPMAHHTGIRQTLRRLLKRTSEKPDTAMIRSITGERLNFKPEHEMEIYFTAYLQNFVEKCQQILHINLRFFLFAFSFNDFVLALNRIPDILQNDGTFVESIIVLTTKYTCWIMGVITLLNIMMERVFAFWYYQKYDDWSNTVPYMPMAVILAQYSVIGLEGFAVTQKWISFETHVLILFTLAMMTYLIFPITQWIMMKRIKRREERRFEMGIYNVNGRFQNHEIRRCVGMLRNYVLFQGFCWFLAVTISSYFQFVVVPQHPEYRMLAEQIGYVINNPRAIISMLIPIAYHTGIQEAIVRIFKRRRVPTKTDPGTIHSLTGQQLNFTPEQERDLYFAIRFGLMSNWSRNLEMSLSEWHFEASCCREAIISMRVVEVSNLIATAIASLIYVRILLTTKILHVNLRLLFSISVLNDLFLLLIRLFDIVNVSGLLDENEILTFFKFNSWVYAVVIIFTIVCERVYSVLTYQTYDESSNSFPRVCIFIVLSEYGASLAFTWLMAKGYVVRSTYVKVALFIAFLALLVFIFSVYYTSKHAKQIMENRYRLMNNNIARRYQMLQAERSSEMLKWYIPFQALMNISTITCAVATTLFIRAHTPQYYLVSIEALYICIGPRIVKYVCNLHVIGACFIAIKRHPALRKEFNLFLSMLRGNLSSAETATTITAGDSNIVHVTVQSATGAQLNFTPDREQEMYFKADSPSATAPNSALMLLGENDNWTKSLLVPMSEWHYEVSCCRDGIISLRLIETLNIFITTAVAALSFRILKNTEILHINLRILIIISVLNDLSLSYIRIFDIVNVSGLLTEHPDLKVLRFSSWMFGLIIPLVIVLERIYAVKYHRSYEQEVSPRNCILAIILAYAVAFNLTIGLFKGFYSKIIYRWIVVLFATSIVLTLVYYTQYTRKHAKRIMEIRFRLMSNNIASRYQVIEAQRSAHMLKWYIPYQAFISIVMIMAGMAIRALILMQHPRYYIFSLQILYSFVGFRASTAMIMLVLRHPTLRRELLRILKCSSTQTKDLRESVTKSMHATVLSSHGAPLNFTSDQEKAMYFQSYKIAWS